jgi:hypothetical protein
MDGPALRKAERASASGFVVSSSRAFTHVPLAGRQQIPVVRKESNTPQVVELLWSRCCKLRRLPVAVICIASCAARLKMAGIGGLLCSMDFFSRGVSCISCVRAGFS